MAFDESLQTARPIVEAINKLNESSSSLANEMIKLSKRIYWLNWLIAILTLFMSLHPVWSYIRS